MIFLEPIFSKNVVDCVDMALATSVFSNNRLEWLMIELKSNIKQEKSMTEQQHGVKVNLLLPANIRLVKNDKRTGSENKNHQCF